LRAKVAVDCVWNVMSHTQKPDFVFRRNGRVHLNRRGRQVSRLLTAEVFASAVVMLDTPYSGVVWRVLATHSIRQFPLHLPSRASQCAITFQLDSTYERTSLALRNLSKTELILTIVLFNNSEKFCFPKIKIWRKSVEWEPRGSIRTGRLTDECAEADGPLPQCLANAPKSTAQRWHLITSRWHKTSWKSNEWDQNMVGGAHPIPPPPAFHTFRWLCSEDTSKNMRMFMHIYVVTVTANL
jgi:hypothetical protein